MAKENGWFLYLLECEDGSVYTGIAVDVEKRYQQHVSGKGARYTRARRPRRLLATQAFPDRSSASKAEYAVKQLKAEEKRAFARTLARGRKKLKPAAPRPRKAAAPSPRR